MGLGQGQGQGGDHTPEGHMEDGPGEGGVRSSFGGEDRWKVFEPCGCVSDDGMKKQN